jgi:hypothetical protein
MKTFSANRRSCGKMKETIDSISKLWFQLSYRINKIIYIFVILIVVCTRTVPGISPWPHCTRKVKQYAATGFKSGDFDVTDGWSMVGIKKSFRKWSFWAKPNCEFGFQGSSDLTRILDLLCKKGYVERYHIQWSKFSVPHWNGRSKVAALRPQIRFAKKAWENLFTVGFRRV